MNKFIYIRILFVVIISGLYPSCVQETHLKTVHFKLDMSELSNVSSVGIRGAFTENPWNETILFTDLNNDGIYEGTIKKKTAQNEVEFKFVKNEKFELENQNNRTIKFEYKPETIIYEAVFNKPKAKLLKTD